MIQDVYEPLSRYRDEFKAGFAWRTEEKFEELTRASGIDVESNRRLVAEIKELETHSKEARGRRSLFGCLFVLLVTGAVVAFIAAYNEVGNPTLLVALGIIGIIASLFLLSPWQLYPSFDEEQHHQSADEVSLLKVPLPWAQLGNHLHHHQRYLCNLWIVS